MRAARAQTRRARRYLDGLDKFGQRFVVGRHRDGRFLAVQRPRHQSGDGFRGQLAGIGHCPVQTSAHARPICYLQLDARVRFLDDQHALELRDETGDEFAGQGIRRADLEHWH